ncbi:MAG: aspartyl protease family protein [Candidatus Parcubacteria bacterium]|nr:aspartyl protease family protein [Candidatus Paceibacterota bacterium]
MKNLNLSLSEPLNPTLTLQVQAGANHGPQLPQPKRAQINALVDTGFDDYISIPARLAQDLGLEIIGQTEVELANGSQYMVSVAVGQVSLVAYPEITLDVNILLGDDEEALVGTRLLAGICDKFSN